MLNPRSYAIKKKDERERLRLYRLKQKLNKVADHMPNNQGTENKENDDDQLPSTSQIDSQFSNNNQNTEVSQGLPKPYRQVLVNGSRF